MYINWETNYLPVNMALILREKKGFGPRQRPRKALSWPGTPPFERIPARTGAAGPHSTRLQRIKKGDVKHVACGRSLSRNGTTRELGALPEGHDWHRPTKHQ